MRHSCKGVGLEWEWSYCTLRYTVYTCCTRRTDKVRNRPSVVRVKDTVGNLDHGGTSERALVRRSYRRITLNRRPVMLVQTITQHRCLTQCFILINAHHCINFILSPSRSPWRIIEDCGAAFVMGCIGGGVFSFWKGYRNSPVVSTIRVTMVDVR